MLLTVIGHLRAFSVVPCGSLALVLATGAQVFGVAVPGVPVISVVTSAPRQLRGEPSKHVEEGPGANDHIVNVDKEPVAKLSIAKTLEERGQLVKHLENKEKGEKMVITSFIAKSVL